MTTPIQSQDLEHSPDGRGPTVEPPAQAVTRRHERIAEGAYQRAEQRGFTPGCELDDWLAAEREFDAAR